MKADISKLLQESNLIDQFVIHHIDTVSKDLLITKPDAKTWSVIEVLQHLNLVSELYFPRFESAISSLETEDQDGEVFDEQKISWKAGQMANLMKPKGNKRKFKMDTFDFFKPSISDSEVESVLTSYKRNREKFNHYIKLCRKPFARKIVVTSAIKILKFSLPEAIYWLLSHEQRHIVQMEETLAQIRKEAVV